MAGAVDAAVEKYVSFAAVEAAAGARRLNMSPADALADLWPERSRGCGFEFYAAERAVVRRALPLLEAKLEAEAAARKAGRPLPGSCQAGAPLDAGALAALRAHTADALGRVRELAGAGGQLSCCVDSTFETLSGQPAFTEVAGSPLAAKSRLAGPGVLSAELAKATLKDGALTKAAVALLEAVKDELFELPLVPPAKRRRFKKVAKKKTAKKKVQPEAEAEDQRAFVDERFGAAVDAARGEIEAAAAAGVRLLQDLGCIFACAAGDGWKEAAVEQRCIPPENRTFTKERDSDDEEVSTVGAVLSAQAAKPSDVRLADDAAVVAAVARSAEAYEMPAGKFVAWIKGGDSGGRAGGQKKVAKKKKTAMPKAELEAPAAADAAPASEAQRPKKRARKDGAVDSPWQLAQQGDAAGLMEAKWLNEATVGYRHAATGKTLLATAAGGGHLEAVKYLLDRGADPNAADGPPAPQETAVHAAVRGGHAAVLECLLAHGGLRTGGGGCASPQDLLGECSSPQARELCRALLGDQRQTAAPRSCGSEAAAIQALADVAKLDPPFHEDILINPCAVAATLRVKAPTLGDYVSANGGLRVCASMVRLDSNFRFSRPRSSEPEHCLAYVTVLLEMEGECELPVLPNVPQTTDVWALMLAWGDEGPPTPTERQMAVGVPFVTVQHPCDLMCDLSVECTSKNPGGHLTFFTIAVTANDAVGLASSKVSAHPFDLAETVELCNA